MKYPLLILMTMTLLFAAAVAPAAQARESNPGEWHEIVDGEPVPVTTEPDGTTAKPALFYSDPLLLAGTVAAGAGCGGAWGGSCGGWNGVSGDGNMLKVYTPDTMERVVYLQCGKKVAVLEPPGCYCSASNFRYTYSCKRPPTIYVTFPCHSK